MTYADLTPKQQAVYAGLDRESKLAEIHAVGQPPVLRFRKNRAISVLFQLANINDMWRVLDGDNESDIKDAMQAYRLSGYSLCGFLDIFEDHIERFGL